MSSGEGDLGLFKAKTLGELAMEDACENAANGAGIVVELAAEDAHVAPLAVEPRLAVRSTDPRTFGFDSRSAPRPDVITMPLAPAGAPDVAQAASGAR